MQVSQSPTAIMRHNEVYRREISPFAPENAGSSRGISFSPKFRLACNAGSSKVDCTRIYLRHGLLFSNAMKRTVLFCVLFTALSIF